MGKLFFLPGAFPQLLRKAASLSRQQLQLNHDLASFNAEELSAIARAELRRNNAVNYRSYTVEADNRVCVIGDSVEQLDSFIGIYGGVLDITPLLVKGFHPEIPTATRVAHR